MTYDLWQSRTVELYTSFILTPPLIKQENSSLSPVEQFLHICFQNKMEHYQPCLQLFQQHEMDKFEEKHLILITEADLTEMSILMGPKICIRTQLAELRLYCQQE